MQKNLALKNPSTDTNTTQGATSSQKGRFVLKRKFPLYLKDHSGGTMFHCGAVPRCIKRSPSAFISEKGLLLKKDLPPLPAPEDISTGGLRHNDNRRIIS